MNPIHADRFYHDGRGPELQRVHWAGNGEVIQAIDYFNPDDTYDAAHLKHVAFTKPQVVMITPEEVINYKGDGLVRHRPAALFDLGKTDWLRTFSPRHLERCRHFQLYFYDELFDVIAEDVACLSGGFEGVTS